MKAKEPDIKCLSIRHPWATLIVNRKRGVDLKAVNVDELGLGQYAAMGIGFLAIEVRSTPYRHRGIMLIRQSVTPDILACDRLQISRQVHHKQMVIGWGTLVDVEENVDIGRFDQFRPYSFEYGKYSGGLNLILIADPHPIAEPFQTRPLIGLYRVNAEELARINDPDLLVAMNNPQKDQPVKVLNASDQKPRPLKQSNSSQMKLNL